MARRYTLAEIKARSTGHFFDRETMRCWQGDKYGTRYDKITRTNYVVVTHPHSRGGGRAWWKFDPVTGKLHPVRASDVPSRVREKKVKGRVS